LPAPGWRPQGRSLKVVLLRVYLALLAAAQKWYAAAGGKKNRDNPADPYMTLLGYLNSLRELGGSRRIIEDEVNTQVTNRSNPRRATPRSGTRWRRCRAAVSTGDAPERACLK
jgi:hypothetical protein